MEIKRNRYTFGIGTIGRDMVYALFSMYLLVFITEVLSPPSGTLLWITVIIVAARIFDAATDPIMGVIVDNTKTRWGKFKPWLLVGMLASPFLTVLLFTDFGLTGAPFIIVFSVIYVLWGIAYTTHDISFWSMLPTLSLNQKEREKIGAIARICANIGLFIVAAAIIPVTNIMAEHFAGAPLDQVQDTRPYFSRAYFIFALTASAIMAVGLLVTLFGVKEPGVVVDKKQATPLREMLKIIFKNDQLLCVAIAMSLFMIGYLTTVTFGVYFFEYDYGDGGMYMVFAIILGASQIIALTIFPLFSKRFSRKTLFTTAMVLMTAGYLIFFFAPVTTMLFIAVSGVLLFVGQGFVQVLMLMFLADSVDYGHWKLGKRNDSVSFSLQPFINKLGAAIASGIVMLTLVISGIHYAETAADVAEGGLLIMRGAMLILPLACVVISYIIWRAKYKIDEKFHAQILSDLRGKGEVTDG